MTTDITELAQRLKLEVHRAVSNFNPNMNIKTRDLKELVEALEKAQQRITSQREYYEGVIVDGGKRIAELESCVSNLKVNRPVVYGDGFHEGYWKARSEQSMSSEDENHG